MTFVTKQLRLLWNDRMVRMLFGDLYAEAELDDPGAKVATPATSSVANCAGPSSSNGGAMPTGLTDPSSSPTRRPIQSLSFSNSRGFDLDHYKGRVRHGLNNFLHQISLSRAKRKLRSGLASVVNATGAGSVVSFGTGCCSTTGPAGPNDLPESLKAVCMLYCFTVASLREIRNDILAGKYMTVQFDLLSP